MCELDKFRGVIKVKLMIIVTPISMFSAVLRGNNSRQKGIHIFIARSNSQVQGENFQLLMYLDVVLSRVALLDMGLSSTCVDVLFYQDPRGSVFYLVFVSADVSRFTLMKSLYILKLNDIPWVQEKSKPVVVFCWCWNLKQRRKDIGELVL